MGHFDHFCGIFARFPINFRLIETYAVDVLKSFPNLFSFIKVRRAPLNAWCREPFECECFHIQDMHWWHIHISVQMKIKMCCVILMLKLYICKWAQGLMGVSSPWTSPFSLPDCRTEIRKQFEQPNRFFYYLISFRLLNGSRLLFQNKKSLIL